MKKISSQNPVSHLLTCCLALLLAAPLSAGGARRPETTIPLVVAPGWNLMSLPVCVDNGDRDSLFPTAVSPAYVFRDPTGYQIQDTMRHGTGFWLKFDSSETVLLTGEVFLRDTIEVQAGWNIIGSLSIPLVFDSLRTEPPGIITAPVYGYLPGTGYRVADTLFPGFGYWVKADQEGVILLASLGGFPCPGTPIVPYAGKTYNTVQIGSQCWLRENLDIGTMIPGVQNQADNGVIEKYCYDNLEAYCDTFGGLYQWDETMQYSVTPGVQGICPPGWSVPTLTEFQTLNTIVAGAGNALKAVGQGSGAGAGTNASGFSALLAGNRHNDGSFHSLGESALVWASTEENVTNARLLLLYSYNDLIDLFNDAGKGIGFSVRCLYDSGLNQPPHAPSHPSPDSAESSVYTSPTLRWICADPDEDPLNFDVYFGTANPPDTLVSANQDSLSLARPALAGGTTHYWRVVAKDNHAHQTSSPVWSFTTQAGAGLPCPGIPAVSHGGRTYTTVQIGNQCWLRENIDIGTRIDDAQDQSDNGVMEKYCYDNSPTKCDTFGGLYQWNEALQYGSGPWGQGICPPGWHVPSLSELERLGDIVGWDGNALKAVGQGSGAGAGTNGSGFSALLAGRRLAGGEFGDLRTYAWIWSSTEDDVDIARTLRLDAGTSSIFMNHYASMNGGLSVRCLKD